MQLPKKCVYVISLVCLLNNHEIQMHFSMNNPQVAYLIHVFYTVGEVYKVEVKEPPQGVTPPPQNIKRQQRRQVRLK